MRQDQKLLERYQDMLETPSAELTVEEVRPKIKSSPTMDITSVSKEACDKQCFLGSLQLYSDKYGSFLKRVWVWAYSICIDLTDFSYDSAKRQMLGNRKLASYLPVAIDHEEDV